MKFYVDRDLPVPLGRAAPRPDRIRDRLRRACRSGERLPSVRELADADRRCADDGQPSLSRPEEGRADRGAGRLGHVRRRRLAPARTSARRHGGSPPPHRHADRGRASAMGLYAERPPLAVQCAHLLPRPRAAAAAGSRWSWASFRRRRARYARLIASAISAASVDRRRGHPRGAASAIQRSEADCDRRTSSSPSPTGSREVEALLPARRSCQISFIPSEETRLALASLDPLGAHRHRLPLSGVPADHDGRRAALRAACAEDLAAVLDGRPSSAAAIAAAT